ncbi:hypothetical protein FGO68_gene16013 [Halteria grandinella]|uniref:Uncharacterized protein n=1 Tax=Halteria grandinella TaxID=5974 RepID=A0A8J8NJS1_HALGN|nr:hypothetical protein FGO68_gene16013 [Halteria grandinella]
MVSLPHYAQRFNACNFVLPWGPIHHPFVFKLHLLKAWGCHLNDEFRQFEGSVWLWVYSCDDSVELSEGNATLAKDQTAIILMSFEMACQVIHCFFNSIHLRRCKLLIRIVRGFIIMFPSSDIKPALIWWLYSPIDPSFPRWLVCIEQTLGHVKVHYMGEELLKIFRLDLHNLRVVVVAMQAEDAKLSQGYGD